jgi:hypothetical protein
LHAVSRSIRFLSILVLSMLAATSCAHDMSSATADSDARKAAHEPFSDPKADALLCDRSMRSASRMVTEALGKAGLRNVVEGAAPTYFLHRNPDENLSRYDLEHARFFRAGYADGGIRRALRAEVLPIRGKDCFSVKFWEDCSPDTAPEGAPHDWHWCGDPVSSTFINRVQALRPLLGATAGAIEPD